METGIILPYGLAKGLAYVFTELRIRYILLLLQLVM